MLKCEELGIVGYSPKSEILYILISEKIITHKEKETARKKLQYIEKGKKSKYRGYTFISNRKTFSTK